MKIQTVTEQKNKPGEVITTTYNVALADTKGNIPNALVKIEDGKVYITIPDTHTLTTSNQIYGNCYRW